MEPNLRAERGKGWKRRDGGTRLGSLVAMLVCAKVKAPPLALKLQPSRLPSALSSQGRRPGSPTAARPLQANRSGDAFSGRRVRQASRHAKARQRSRRWRRRQASLWQPLSQQGARFGRQVGQKDGQSREKGAFAGTQTSRTAEASLCRSLPLKDGRQRRPVVKPRACFGPEEKKNTHEDFSFDHSKMGIDKEASISGHVQSCLPSPVI